jgi:3-hydroxybutyryl-CoA dehydrogenase
MNIVVLGAGTMGNGIAQVFAQAGHAVTLRDLDRPILDRALAAIDKSLAKLAEKGKIGPGEREAALGRIAAVTELEAAAGADLAVEAVVEDLQVKSALFRELDRLAPPQAILASNTSSISITKLGAATRRPDKVIGMHFMNPVPLMALVEVIRGQATSDETTRAVMDLSQALGKTPVEVNDFPGFVSNRVLMPMINEAVFAVYEGVATPEAIDQILKLGMNHPMGPLTLADFIGLDVCLAILNVLHDGLGDPKYRPCPLLRRMVDAGWLGRKSGRGFYSY